MGRGHVGAAIALGAVLAGAILVVPAAAALKWQLLAGGAANSSSPAALKAYLAVDRGSTAAFASRLSTVGRTALGNVDYSREAVVAVFGEWGCQDHRVAVSSVVRRGITVVVTLARKQPAPGTVECQAIYPTFRLLDITKASLGRPLPSQAQAQLAPS